MEIQSQRSNMNFNRARCKSMHIGTKNVCKLKIVSGDSEPEKDLGAEYK